MTDTPASPSAFSSAAKSRLRERAAHGTVSPSGTFKEAGTSEVERAMKAWGRYTPGPGNYEIPSSFSRAYKKGKPVGSVSSKAMVSTGALTAAVENPGPGKYDAFNMNAKPVGASGVRHAMQPRRLDPSYFWTLH